MSGAVRVDRPVMEWDAGGVLGRTCEEYSQPSQTYLHGLSGNRTNGVAERAMHLRELGLSMPKWRSGPETAAILLE